MFGHIFGILLDPVKTWEKIAALPDREIKKLLPYPIVMALIPAISFSGPFQLPFGSPRHLPIFHLR